MLSIYLQSSHPLLTHLQHVEGKSISMTAPLTFHILCLTYEWHIICLLTLDGGHTHTQTHIQTLHIGVPKVELLKKNKARRNVFLPHAVYSCCLSAIVCHGLCSW